MGCAHTPWPRSGGRLAPIGLALVVAACSASQQPPKPKSTQGVRKMSALLLTIAPEHPEVIVGESLNVTVTLEEGPNLIEVYASDFAYREASEIVTVIYERQ